MYSEAPSERIMWASVAFFLLATSTSVPMVSSISVTIVLFVQVVEETNILTDGCLIDLCGVTLIWRTAMGLGQAPVWRIFPSVCKLHSLFQHRAEN